MKCFKNVILFGHSPPFYCAQSEMLQKRDVQKMKCFRNVTFKTYNVSETWHARYEMFQKCNIHNMKYSRNVKFKTWNVSETSLLWNIVWTLDTLLLCPVTKYVRVYCYYKFQFPVLPTWLEKTCLKMCCLRIQRVLMMTLKMTLKSNSQFISR